MRLKLLLEKRDAAVISLLHRLAPLSTLRLYRCSATLFDAAMGGALPAGLATLEVTCMHNDWLSADTVRCIGRLKQLTVLVMETAKQVGISKADMVRYRYIDTHQMGFGNQEDSFLLTSERKPGGQVPPHL